MTPLEQIACVRDTVDRFTQGSPTHTMAVIAVCDLAERALLTDEEAEAVRNELDLGTIRHRLAVRVLRRLLPAPERVEHRLSEWYYRAPGGTKFECSCGKKFVAPLDGLDAAVRVWAAHAGIGGTS